MSPHPPQFLHAAHLFLDEPLQETGPLPEAIGEIAERATLGAFDRLVSAALEHQVHFLLLTGNSFREASRSLPARTALLRGCRQLAEQDIPVLVAPGPADPPGAWQNLPEWPENLILLTQDHAQPVEDGTGQILATVRLLEETTFGAQHGEPQGESPNSPGEARQPVRIGVLSPPPDGSEAFEEAAFEQERTSCEIDYWALSRPERKTVTLSQGRVAHSPGGIQGFGPNQTGPHGATLVSIQSDGTFKTAFIPTAVVRREHFHLEITGATSRETLLETMQTTLAEHSPEPGEQAWLVRWSLQGEGDLFDSLRDEDQRRQLSEAVLSPESFGREPVVHHVIDLVPAPLESEGKQPQPRETAPLAEQYAAILASELPASPEGLAELCDQAELPPEWRQRLASLQESMEMRLITAQARHWGRKWLRPPSQEGSAS